jgi:hypothetical protein
MMSNICRICGSPESGAIANARALGLEQEFLSGIHTCCQIANWADEQSLAWSEAAHEGDEPAHKVTKLPELNLVEAVLVPVRLRRPHVQRL